MKVWRETAVGAAIVDKVYPVTPPTITVKTGMITGEVIELKVTERGITIGFTGPLDTSTASDIQNYSIEQWNYKWTSGYGSSDFKLSDPNAKGHDPVEIKSVQVNADKKTVFLEVPGLQPVDQMQIKMNLKSADGGRVPDKITNTINVVAKEQG